MGTLIWTLQTRGRLEAAASSILGRREAASLIHWQAPCLSVTVGVFFWRLETPVQHSCVGEPPLVRYEIQGARNEFTWVHGMARPGSTMEATMTKPTIATPKTLFMFNIGTLGYSL